MAVFLLRLVHKDAHKNRRIAASKAWYTQTQSLSYEVFSGGHRLLCWQTFNAAKYAACAVAPILKHILNPRECSGADRLHFRLIKRHVGMMDKIAHFNSVSVQLFLARCAKKYFDSP